VDVLLAVNARPNTIDRSGSSALLEACRGGQDEILDALLTRSAKLGLDKTHTFLELAAAVTNGDLPLLERLLRCGADAGATDGEKNTALHIAAGDGNLAAVRGVWWDWGWGWGGGGGGWGGGGGGGGMG